MSRAWSSSTTSRTVSRRLQKIRALSPLSSCGRIFVMARWSTCIFPSAGGQRSPTRSLHQKVCSTSLQAESFVPAQFTWMGSHLQVSRAKCSMLSSQVAVKSSTCLSGRTCVRTRRTCSPKPSLSSRSASSRTTKVARRRFVWRSLSMWMRRPGVATMMSTRSRKARRCSPWSSPPQTARHTSPVYTSKAWISFATCLQSSPVGTSTRPTGPSPGFSSGCAMMWTSMGRT
mmetsp:Transcript_114016/g.322788  ORF Transcript_114016/g.322788 Transcript_114016/m.322788 type:complete len:230 (+) Transcript_114016:698-1387(+)